MNPESKVTPEHLQRAAYLYVRQSTLRQVIENTESTQRQYALRRRATALGWTEDRIIVIDHDQGQSGASSADREGFQRLVADVGLGKAGIVMGLEVSRLARNCADWHRLLEICGLTRTLWEERVGVITYRKNVTDTWPENEFTETQVPCPGGGTIPMRLARRETGLTARKAAPVPLLEVRRLTDSGHQTAIITTARSLASPAIAGRMFSRWCQENYFGYMMQHYDIDGLVQYGSEEIPGATRIINPAWRELDKQITRLNTQLRRHQAKLGAAPPPDPDDGQKIAQRAALLETIQSLQTQREAHKANRRATPRKIAIGELPEAERPRQLLPLAKTLTDTIKMIAYRAETALVGLLRPHLAHEAEARALIRELFVSSADLEPDDTAGTLTIRIHRMASPVHDRAINQLLATGRRLVLYPGSLELESAPNISPSHNLCQPAKPGTSLGTPAFAHSGWEKLTHAGVNHWANLALQSAQCIVILVNSPSCQSVTRVP